VRADGAGGEPFLPELIDATPGELATAVSLGQPSDELDLHQVGARTARGAVALVGRQIVSLGLTFLGGVLLARFLTPRDFGTYAVVYIVYAYIAAVGDGGIGASLVRQKPTPTKLEEGVVLAGQATVALVGSALILTLGHVLVAAYGLGAQGDHLLALTTIALLLSPLQVIPTVRLERQLRYDVVGAVGIAQSVVFNVTAVCLAASGFGVAALGVALAAQSATATCLLLAMQPVRVRPRWHWPTFSAHLRFGLPYQGMTFVSLAKDSISPLFVGALLGASAVGYLEWAQRFAAIALLALLSLSRLYLASFSRVLDRPTELQRLFSGVVWGCNALAAPVAAVLLVLAHPITRLVFGVKWAPALPVFFLLWAANLVVPAAGPLLGVLNASGAARAAFGFTLLWMVATWVLGAPLVVLFGLRGYGVANIIVQTTNVLLYLSVRARTGVRLRARDFKPLLYAAACGGLCAALADIQTINTLAALAGTIAAGLALYVALVLVGDRPRLRTVWSLVRAA
jgi:O-antigen/teichoic acid export membrane protein